MISTAGSLDMLPRFAIDNLVDGLTLDAVSSGKVKPGCRSVGDGGSDVPDSLFGQKRSMLTLAARNSFRMRSRPVSVTSGYPFGVGSRAVPLTPGCAFWMFAKSVILAAGGIESVLRSRIKGVVLDGSTEEVAPIATARRVTRVADKQGEHIGSVMEQVGNPGGLQGSAMGLEQPVSILVSATLPKPTRIRTPYVNLRPEPSDVRVGEGWQGLGSGHVEPPFLASLRQFYQKGGF